MARRWLPMTVSTIVSHLSLFLVLLLALRYVGVTGAQVSWSQALAVFAFGRLASAVPFTPGGLGVVEAAYIQGLVLAGGAHARVVAAVLVFRALTYGIQIPLGAITYVVWQRKKKWRKPQAATEVVAAPMEQPPDGNHGAAISPHAVHAPSIGRPHFRSRGRGPGGQRHPDRPQACGRVRGPGLPFRQPVAGELLLADLDRYAAGQLLRCCGGRRAGVADQERSPGGGSGSIRSGSVGPCESGQASRLPRPAGPAVEQCDPSSRPRGGTWLRGGTRGHRVRSGDRGLPLPGPGGRVG